MGRDKAGIVVDEATGETLAARAVRVLREVSTEVLVLGHGRGVDETLERLDDELPGAGPLGGVLALLASGRAPVYVVMPVDMPLVTAAHLRLLLDAQEKSAALGACFVRAEHTAQSEPLPFVVDGRAELLLRELLDRGERRVGQFVDELSPATVPLADPETLKNMNLPEDLGNSIGGSGNR
jgi:molybdopterin-guanine dinucleotide biosynthesis protein A